MNNEEAAASTLAAPKRIIREEMLTTEEAAQYEAVRAQVETEFPPVTAESYTVIITVERHIRSESHIEHRTVARWEGQPNATRGAACDLADTLAFTGGLDDAWLGDEREAVPAAETNTLNAEVLA